MRVRARFTNLGKVRFTSHRDVARIWERTLRRAEVPVARTQGFHPRPKLHFGLALSTGYESLAEYLDIDIVEGREIALDGLADRFSACLPRGLDVTAVGEVPPGTLSLQHAVVSCRWEIEVLGLDPAATGERTDALLAATELTTTRERKGKAVTDDVRPHLRALTPLAPCAGGTLLVAELGAQDRGLRPAELVRLLDEDAGLGLVRRTHQFTEHDGLRSEPLPLAEHPTGPEGPVALAGPAGSEPRAPHALGRAS